MNVLHGLLAAALCVLLPHAASAAVSAARCSGCSTELAWQQKAIGQGAGSRYVYDFASRQLRKYQVASEYEPELHRYVSFATPLNVEPAYAGYFLDAADVREQIGGLSKAIVVNLGGTTGGHAHDSRTTRRHLDTEWRKNLDHQRVGRRRSARLGPRAGGNPRLPGGKRHAGFRNQRYPR